MRNVFFGLCAAAVLMSGCAVNKYCLDEQDYHSAKAVPPLTAVEGLKLPESASALRIPQPPVQAVPFGEKVKDADGDEKARCLDTPPAMPPMAEPKAAEAPAKS